MSHTVHCKGSLVECCLSGDAYYLFTHKLTKQLFLAQSSLSYYCNLSSLILTWGSVVVVLSSWTEHSAILLKNASKYFPSLDRTQPALVWDWVLQNQEFYPKMANVGFRFGIVAYKNMEGFHFPSFPN